MSRLRIFRPGHEVRFLALVLNLRPKLEQQFHFVLSQRLSYLDWGPRRNSTRCVKWSSYRNLRRRRQHPIQVAGVSERQHTAGATTKGADERPNLSSCSARRTFLDRDPYSGRPPWHLCRRKTWMYHQKTGPVRQHQGLGKQGSPSRQETEILLWHMP